MPVFSSRTVCLFFPIAAFFCSSIAWAQSDPADFETVIDVPPALFGNGVETILSDTQVNVLDGGRVSARLSAGSFDGSDSNVEVNVFAGGTISGGLTANLGSSVNVLGGTFGAENIGGQLSANGGTINIFDGAQVFFRLGASDGGQVEISGGTVSDLTSITDATVNVSGGMVTLDSFFDVNGNGVLNISGGDVSQNGDPLSFFGDGTINVSGGQVERVASEVVNASGGTITRSIIAERGRLTGGRQQTIDLGSGSSIVGGEFFLNGEPIADAVTLEQSFFGFPFAPPTDVLTGTLTDGTPFVFSSLTDNLENVSLEQTSLSPVDTSPTVVGAGDVSNGLRAGQTLTVEAGGSLGDAYAAVNATLNIQGGTVGDGLKLAGSDVTIGPDSIVGSGVSAFGGSIDLTGGRVGEDFRVQAGTDVRLAGGAIGRGLEIDQNATATIVASDLKLNGETVTDSQVTLPRFSNDVLTGVFADGTPFAFSQSTGDSLAVQISVEQVTLADPSLTPIVVDGSTTNVPAGLRPGQSLTVQEGGQLLEEFTVLDSTLNVEGGFVTQTTEIVRSTVNVSGGEFGDVSGSIEALFGTAIQVSDNSTLNISGGNAGLVEINNDSVANVSGGAVGRIEIGGGGEVNFSGGSVNRLFVRGDGVLNIFGGPFDELVTAVPDAEINVFGSEFFIDGVLIDDLALGEMRMLDLSSGGFSLSGLLSDGSDFRFVVRRSGLTTFSEDARLTIIRAAAIPEPTVLPLFAAAALLFGRRRCKRVV